MYPSLVNNQIVFIKKYKLNLEHNDIIVAKKNKKIVIKRLIGMPGDIIKIDEYVYVNGKKIDNLLTNQEEMESYEIFLKENEYFVLGDNRDNSIDSRFNEIGIINEKEIKGKVIKI